ALARTSSMPRLTGIAGIIGTTIQPQPGGNPSSHHPSPPTGNNISQPAISTPVRLHCLSPAPRRSRICVHAPTSVRDIVMGEGFLNVQQVADGAEQSTSLQAGALLQTAAGLQPLIRTYQDEIE